MTPEQMAEAYRLAAGIVENGANTGPTYDTDNSAWCVGDREVELLAGAVAALQRENAALREALSKVCIAAAYYGGDYVEREVDAVLNATLAPSAAPGEGE